MATRSIDLNDKPEAYWLIRDAIRTRKQVIATYRGYRRQLCPHSLGLSKLGEVIALFYQFGGESPEPLGPEGSPDNWRCMRIAELTDVSVREGTWHTAPGHSRPQTCVFQKVDLAVAAD